MSGSVNVLPHRGIPVLTVNPALRQGQQQDPSMALMSRPWYLFFEALFNGSLGGVAGGDLSGNYPDPTVVGLQGNPIDSTLPSTSDVLTWNGTKWAPASPSVTPGAATIDYHTVSGATTITASVMPAPTNGLLRVVIDFSAAVQPVFDPTDFSLAPTSLVDKIGTRSIICFCADGAGKWAMEAAPVTGR